MTFSSFYLYSSGMITWQKQPRQKNDDKNLSGVRTYIENGLILLAFEFSQLIVNLDQPNVTEGTCSVRVLIS